MKKLNLKIIVFLLIIVILLIFIGIGVKFLIEEKEENTAVSSIEFDDDDPTYDEKSAINIILEGSTINTKSKNVEVNQNAAIIKTGGIYVLSGSLNGNISIDTIDQVRIILKDATIESTDGPAIYVKNADKVIVTLAENTSNFLKDSTNYSDAEAVATVYSKDDLVFNGYGSLSVEGTYQDGIVSKDDLKIISGTYNVNAMNNGIKGKDSVKIKDGDVTVVAQNDCIKSTNLEEEGKGYVEIKKRYI